MGLTAAFWRGRRVLLTGHTGFKGAWLALWLERLGARVTGFALEADGDPNLFRLLAPWPRLDSIIGDVRDADAVARAVERADPEIAFHMAAQSLVRRGYREPVATLAINVLGTANLLEALRACEGLRAVVVVTSDKCYDDSRGGPYGEDDRLGGRDPYSASKACQEVTTHSWRRSFYDAGGAALATARAGNVVGGGDWAEDRLLPDVFRALAAGAPVGLRRPDATRPWQHVLEPLSGYLILAETLAEGGAEAAPPALNFGPDPAAVRPVAEVVERVLARWGEAPPWEKAGDPGPDETPELTLDARLARETLGWRPRLTLDETLDWTVEWHRDYAAGEAARRLTLAQIERYEARLARP